MRRAASLVGLLGLGLLGGHALAGPVPIPVPTVSTSVPLPVPTVPTPVPVPTDPVPLPTVSTAPVVAAPVETTTPTVPGAGATASGGSSAGAGTASSNSSDGSSGSSSSGSSAQPAQSNVQPLHASRSWIGKRGTKRWTTLTFVLPRAARVFFTVSHVSPLCRAAGHFSYRGHAGLNRVRFNGRVGGRQLEPGTYRISARTRGGGTVRRMTLVVVDAAAPTRAQLAAARSANVCPATAGSTGASNTGGLATEHLQPKGQPSASGAAQGSTAHAGVLAATLNKTVEALRPVIIALLALAILLLAVASLPRAAVPGPRFHEVLVRHRVDFVGVGAVALAAVLLVFLFG